MRAHADRVRRLRSKPRSRGCPHHIHSYILRIRSNTLQPWSTSELETTSYKLALSAAFSITTVTRAHWECGCNFLIALKGLRVYGAHMRYSVAVPRCGALARLVLVALLSVSASFAWASPILGSHCARHSLAPSSSSAHAEHDSGPLATPSWTQGSQHDCSHCPPSDCSRVTPCAATGSVAAVEASTSIADLPPHPVTLPPYSRQYPSIAVQPPTPPPQLIA
jgi:hypothetical protein